ncbi:MAG: hypothetical protein NW226_08810, partial [Microscillaceae bacterium]|nr:hypothetical protein [Microscillaceae bacterium]
MPDYTHKSNSEYENDYEDENQYLDLKNRKSPIDTFQAQLKAHLSGQPLETSIQAYFCQQAALKPDPPLRHRIRGAMSHIDPTQRSNYEPESLYAIIATYYDIPQEIEPYQSPSGRYEYRYTNQELIQEIYRDILLLNNIHNQQDHSQYHIGKEILLPTRDYAQHLKAQYQSPEKTQTQTQTAKPETTESLYTKQLEQLKAELNPEERQALDQLLAHKQNLEQTEEKPYDIQNGIPVFDPGKFRNHQEVYQYISLQIQQGDNYFAQHFSIQRLDSPRR